MSSRLPLPPSSNTSSIRRSNRLRARQLLPLGVESHALGASSASQSPLDEDARTRTSSPAPPLLSSTSRVQESTSERPLNQVAVTPSPSPAPPLPNRTSTVRVAKQLRRQSRDLLAQAFQDETETYARLVGFSKDHDVAEQLADRVKSLLRGSSLPLPVPAQSLVPWICSVIKEPSTNGIPSPLVSALAIRQHSVQQARTLRREFTTPIFLYKSPQKLDAFRNSILVIHLKRFPKGQEYPPRDHWVAHTKKSASLWGKYMASTPLPDRRNTKRRWYPPLVVDPSRLQLVIPPEVSCIVKDIDTQVIVFAVFRNFCGDPSILAWAKEIVEYASLSRRSVRLEDAGRIVQVGYGAGSRRAPQFGAVRNLLWRGAETDSTRREISALLTYFWNRAKSVLPADVIEDMEGFYAHYDLPRLDPAWSCSMSELGDLEFPARCGGHRYSRVPLAPGCAVLAQRYARVVHKETQGHRYGLNWQSLREGSNCHGGDFHVAQYGILMRAAPDCIFTWMPEDWHCSSLGTYDPFADEVDDPNPPFNQHSIAFVTSSRIRKVYKRFKEDQELSGPEKVAQAVAVLEAEPEHESEAE